jgi:hypothetical protein
VRLLPMIHVRIIGCCMMSEGGRTDVASLHGCITPGMNASDAYVLSCLPRSVLKCDTVPSSAFVMVHNLGHN